MAQAGEVKAQLEASAERARGRAQRAQWLRMGGALAGLIVVVTLVNLFSHGAFLTAANLTNVLRQITYNAILAIGQTFVIITAGIDLSVGSLIELTGVVMASFANAFPLDNGFFLVVATLAVGLAVGCGAGLINALPVVKLNLPPFITTLAMMLMARGLAFKLAHGRPVPVNSSAFDAIGTGYSFRGLLQKLRPSRNPHRRVVDARAGRGVRDRLNADAFRPLRLRDRRERGGRASCRHQRRARQDDGLRDFGRLRRGGGTALDGASFRRGRRNTGIGSELQSIAAVVVGGTSLAGGRGSVIGTFFGALLIGLLNNVMNLLDIESYTQDIVLGAVILLAVIVDELRKRYLRT